MRAVTGLGTRLFYWRVGLLGHDLLPDSQICTIINSFYIYSTCMHYPPTVPPWRPHSLKMTLYKNGPFLSLIFFFSFSRKLVHVDFFDFRVCLVMPFFFFGGVQHSGHDVSYTDIMVFSPSSCPWIPSP